MANISQELISVIMAEAQSQRSVCHAEIQILCALQLDIKLMSLCVDYMCVFAVFCLAQLPVSAVCLLNVGFTPVDAVPALVTPVGIPAIVIVSPL